MSLSWFGLPPKESLRKGPEWEVPLGGCSRKQKWGSERRGEQGGKPM